MSTPTSKMPALPAWAHPSQRLIPQECYAELLAYGQSAYQAGRDAALEEVAGHFQDTSVQLANAIRALKGPPTMTTNNPKNFDELVSWATWQVIEGITHGNPLRSVMHGVLTGAMNIMQEWKK